MDMHEITECTRWVTSDHKEHSSKDTAVRWAAEIMKAIAADEMLRAGECLGVIFEKAFDKDCPDVLFDVTKDTKIIISYWQCKDYPLYQIGYFNTNGSIHVGGNQYGNDVRVLDLERYMQDTKKYHAYRAAKE